MGKSVDSHRERELDVLGGQGHGKHPSTSLLVPGQVFSKRIEDLRQARTGSRWPVDGNKQ